MKQSKTPTVFDNFDFGTTVTTSSMDVIQVTINPELIMFDYADALLHDLQRRNPGRYAAATKQLMADKRIQFADEYQAMHSYVAGLCQIRVEAINGNCSNWRKAKALVMTAVLQDALSCVGVITDRAHGFRIVPIMATPVEYDINTMLIVSEFIEMFEDDGIKLFKDAMPRGEEGDVDTMSCIIVGDEVKSMKVDAHPTFSYIAAFLGLKAYAQSDERRFDVRYDLFSYIRFMLLSEVRKCSF